MRLAHGIHKIRLPPVVSSPQLILSSTAITSAASFNLPSSPDIVVGVRSKSILAVTQPSTMARFPAQQSRPVHATSLVNHAAPV